MAYTYGDFWSEVFNSLERDQRFQGGLDIACNRGIDEIFANSDYGNFTYQTTSESGREEYDLPENTLYVNFVTYDTVPMDRIIFDEHLQRKAFAVNGIVYYTRPLNFVIKDNRTMILSPMPRESGKPIVAYLTVKYDDFKIDTDTDKPFPLGRVYSKPAFHFARHYAYLNDNRDADSAKEYQLFEHEMGKISMRLKGSVKTKVKRMV